APAKGGTVTGCTRDFCSFAFGRPLLGSSFWSPRRSRASGVSRTHWTRPWTTPGGQNLRRGSQGGHRPRTVVQLVVEVDRCIDQRQVAERLREVAKLLAGRTDLLREKAQVVSVGQHLLADQAPFLQTAGAGQRVDVPERADGKGPLVAAQPVRGGAGVVAVDQAVRD